ncbi:LPS export ABC transporter periplasmic protein LptC [Prevotella multiformis]|uniref:LPS export ABC transporter periplasmic protein LptC n=1 Tax=Prevotella multiformis TaxID=282402 RepID=UPI0023EF76E2|nr:LPS export ABC transporter periplasmic protein LptC [Prevotella multiformis]
MRPGLYTVFIWVALSVTGHAMQSCSEEHEHTAPAIHDRDSVPVMTTYGVNTLISDSGVIKYRIVTEEWEVNTNRRPSRWTFDKGILLTQFDLKKHVVGYVQCDTAVYYDQDRRWELRGRVRILTAQGLSFYSNELYWDERNHQMWSHSYSHLRTPDKELEGNWFRSDEEMTDYEIRQTKGWGIFSDKELMAGAGGRLAPIDTTHTDNLNGPVVTQR